MAYIWVRPAASPQSAPNWSVNAGQGFPHSSISVPPQYAAEVPCPLTIGCNTNHMWRALDPVHWEYRDPNLPLMGSWPPPQPGPDYDAWLTQQRQWMPYAYIAYNGSVAENSCAETRGVPNAENTAQWLRFDFASSADWPFAQNWSGIRFVCQLNRHHYTTNEGTCESNGFLRLRVGVYKHTAAYPALPATWDPARFAFQEIEFSTFGVGVYVNPYGAGTANAVFDLTTSPDGTWNIAEQDRYWIVIGQVLSTQGLPNGSDNKSLALRKFWAAGIADLTGTPGATSPDTIHSQVTG